MYAFYGVFKHNYVGFWNEKVLYCQNVLFRKITVFLE